MVHACDAALRRQVHRGTARRAVELSPMPSITRFPDMADALQLTRACLFADADADALIQSMLAGGGWRARPRAAAGPVQGSQKARTLRIMRSGFGEKNVCMAVEPGRRETGLAERQKRRRWMQKDADYFTRRVREERQRATDATDKGAAAAHRRLATEYERLVETQRDQTLRLIADE